MEGERGEISQIPLYDAQVTHIFDENVSNTPFTEA